MPRSRRSRARCSTNGAAVHRNTLAFLAVFTVACANGSVDPDRSPVDTVVVVPAVATVTMGASVTLQAEARDADGNLLSRDAFWSVEDSSVVTVSPAGEVTGLRLGQVQVAASVEGKSGLSYITVSRVPVASVRLVPANATIRVGANFSFSADARDAAGAVLANRPITWTSSNPAVATVSASGRVTAHASGAAIISAECEGRTALASVNVSGNAVAAIQVTPTSVTLQPGETRQLFAQPVDEFNAPLTGRTVVWSTSDPSIASVTPGGIVSGIASGSATIAATSEGKSGSVSVLVRTNQPTITISPSSATIDNGRNGGGNDDDDDDDDDDEDGGDNDTVQLTAVYRDGTGREVGKNFQWFTSDSRIATVSSKGKVTGRSSGTVTIRASASGVSGSASVTVR